MGCCPSVSDPSTVGLPDRYSLSEPEEAIVPSYSTCYPFGVTYLRVPTETPVRRYDGRGDRVHRALYGCMLGVHLRA